MADEQRYIVQVFVGSLSLHYEALSIQASKATTAAEIVVCIAEKLQLAEPAGYELAEVVGDEQGRECKERRLAADEHPVGVQLLWPRSDSGTRQEYRLHLRQKVTDGDPPWTDALAMDPQLIRDYFSRFLCQPRDREYPDLCQLPALTEETLLANLRARFGSGHIYTYVNSILIALNPFKFYPIYNPKYVKLYQNRRLDELPPHIFAIADAAYQKMLKEARNQCIVISGESGSGKTESTNFLLHHLTALSHKGALACGVEQTILAAGPVLEAFGNSKTAHNNNSSRFGKFIQVNYKENGQVHGAVVQKYLLEKSRIVSQARNERNYHVFYYLLEGASPEEREQLHLLPPAQYRYLSQSECNSLDGIDATYEFNRLKQSMEMVGLPPEKQSKLFALLSAVLLIGNVGFQNKKTTYHHDESVSVRNPELVAVIADLLKVREEVLMAALTYKRARASGEVVVINYRMQEAIAARDTLAKCVYGALFDWIVLQVNSSLLSKKDASREHHGPSIGVLDIFGFEDFGNINSFEQFCINYANEHLQYYFNQHVFKYEQEEYIREGILWQNIAFNDNTGCLQLFEAKMRGLLAILDDQCNFPGATNETLLQKFHKENKGNDFYEVPQKFEHAFLIRHYAGKVKYQVADFREKNLDLMRPDIVSVLKSSSQQFVRELVGTDPVAVFRWAILRAFFRAHSAFMQAGARAAASAASGPARRLSFRKLPAGATAPETGAVRTVRPSDPSNHYCSPTDSLDNRLTMRKNKSFRPRGRSPPRSLKNLDSMRSAAKGGHGSRKPPSTVTAQFQQSLQSLLVTLNQANPFFIRCIKSNLEKDPNRFDDATVSRQLRYTGMLETVRIRRCGYNIRFTYDEFIQMYHILLPRGLLSSQADVAQFLEELGLQEDNLQLGATKLFMRESVRLQLDCRLHQAILARVVVIQRWFRTVAERRHFLRVRSAAIRIQAQVRGFLAQRLYQNLRVRHLAATLIQKVWRGYEVRLWYTSLRQSLIHFQARVRGNSTRRRFREMREEHRRKKSSEDIPEIPGRRGSSLYIFNVDKSPPDEAFLSKESSQEELDDRVPAFSAAAVRRHRDSEESSGVHEDSEPESQHSESQPPPPPPPPPPTRTPAPPPRRPDKRTAVKRSWSTQSEQLPKQPTAAAQLARKAATVDSMPADQPPVVANPPAAAAPAATPKTSDLASAAAAAAILPGPGRTPFNRAKKHIKSMIGVGVKKPAGASPSADSDSDTEETLTMGSSSRSTTPSVATLNSLASSASMASVEEPRSREQRREDRRRVIADRELARASGGVTTLYERQDSVSGVPSPYRRLEKMDSTSSGVSEEDQRRRSSIRSYNVEPPRNQEEALRARLAHQRSASADRDPSVQLAQHHFQRAAKAPKTELCRHCQKPFTSIFVQGFKCSFCKYYFHPKCVAAASNRPCERELALEAQKKKKKSGRWNLQGTSEFTDREDKVITDSVEVKRLEDFITNKIHELDSRADGEAGARRQTSAVDRVFQKALRQFRTNLLSTYSLSHQQADGRLNIKYRDLIESFASIMTSVIDNERENAEFPATMGVNAFRGYLNEFLLTAAEDKPRSKKQKRNRRQAKKKKEKKEEEAIQMLGHSFHSMVINIPTACEICSSFMWLMEKGYVCQNCKLTCHKKCQARVLISCTKEPAPAESCPPDRRVFGVPLQLAMVDGQVPPVLERLLTTLELRGLYTEGLYRKSGVSRRVKHLRDELEDLTDQADLEDVPVHVISAAVKAYLREMPEPLLTFPLYDDFLRAVSIQDRQDQVQTVFGLIDQLPKHNYVLLERLLFHLAFVALHEADNRMSTNALAIVFAPCILRTNRSAAVQDSLRDIAAQTQCVELMLEERLHRLRATLADIDTLDVACLRAQSRLAEEDPALAAYLQELQEEKRRLASVLPRLAAAGGALSASEDELLGPESRAGSSDDLALRSPSEPPPEDWT